MVRTPAERAFRAWQRYVEAIPSAVARFSAARPELGIAAVVKYEEGLKRYARILEREAAAYTPRKR